MRILYLIARILLGLMFLVFGLNGFLHFIPMGPMPAGVAGQYMAALATSHYMTFVSGFQVIGGLLLLVGQYIPLALVILGPIIVNILLFHSLMAPANIGPALFAALLWVILAYSVRSAFAPLFLRRVNSEIRA